MRPEGAGQNHPVDLLQLHLVHQQSEAGMQSRLGKLDGAHVILRDDDILGHAIGECAAVFLDPRGAGGNRAVDDPVGRQDAGQIHLGQHLDDAGPADAGDAGGFYRLVKAVFIRPLLDTDDAETGLQRVLVDADALDGTRRGALAGRNLRALECRTCRRGGGKHALAVADDNLGIGADIDDKGVDLGLLRGLGKHHAGGVGAHMAGDARQHIDPRALVDAKAKLACADLDGGIDGQRKGRAAKLDRVDPQKQVMHDRIADENDLDDILGIEPCLLGSP